MISCCVLLFQAEFFNLSFELLLLFISKLVKSVCLWLVAKLLMSDSRKCFIASLIHASGPRSSLCLVTWSVGVRSSEGTRTLHSFLPTPRVAVTRCTWIKYTLQWQQIVLPAQGAVASSAVELSALSETHGSLKPFSPVGL